MSPMRLSGKAVVSGNSNAGNLVIVVESDGVRQLFEDKVGEIGEAT